LVHKGFTLHKPEGNVYLHKPELNLL